MVIKAIYPGTFDPLTYGHLDIISRADKLFDKLFLAIASNERKKPLFSLEERICFAKKATQNLSEKITIFGFNEVVTNVVKKKKVDVLIRGVRTISDFDREMRFAKVVRYFVPGVETLFMISSDSFSYISSKLVKEIACYGGEIEKFLPLFIAEKVKSRLYSI